MGLADIHIHTLYSYDGTTSMPAVLTRAQYIGLGVIAITDLDEITGPLKAPELVPNFGLEFLPGSEITTCKGDLPAYNILQKVERGLPLIETILTAANLSGFCIELHPWLADWE